MSDSDSGQARNAGKDLQDVTPRVQLEQIQNARKRQSSAKTKMAVHAIQTEHDFDVRMCHLHPVLDLSFDLLLVVFQTLLNHALEVCEEGCTAQRSQSHVAFVSTCRLCQKPESRLGLAGVARMKCIIVTFTKRDRENLLEDFAAEDYALDHLETLLLLSTDPLSSTRQSASKSWTNNVACRVPGMEHPRGVSPAAPPAIPPPARPLRHHCPTSNGVRAMISYTLSHQCHRCNHCIMTPPVHNLKAYLLEGALRAAAMVISWNTVRSLARHS
eukprot:1648457-Rhodomonas_salina.3